jgi:hypothetical protein
VVVDPAAVETLEDAGGSPPARPSSPAELQAARDIDAAASHARAWFSERIGLWSRRWVMAVTMRDGGHSTVTDRRCAGDTDIATQSTRACARMRSTSSASSARSSATGAAHGLSTTPTAPSMASNDPTWSGG